jgi:alpha-D-xyloside xylohydrolase
MESIANGVWRFRWGQHETHTPVSLRETEMNVDALEQLFCHNNSPFSSDEICNEKTIIGITIGLPLRKEEQVYGFGLQLHRLNHTGRKKVIRVNSDPIADTGDSHAPVPFYVTTGGYGVLVDTSRYATFYCGTNLRKGASEYKNIENKTVGTSEIELYRFQKADGVCAMLVDVPFAEGIDLYIFEGPDMKAAVQRYNLFSGGGGLPPIWGLGMWYRSFSLANLEDVMRLSESLREDRMPVDVFGFEPGWQTKAYSCSFIWDESRFPNFGEMLEKLYRMHYKVNLWEHVFVHPMSPMYKELLPYSGDYEVWEGLVPDLSMKEAKEIFSRHHLHEFVEKGISGFKLDECDSYDFVNSNWSFPDVTKFPSGLDGEQMHNQLGMLYQYAIQAPFELVGKRTWSQVRSSGALAAPLPFVLYSDLYDHKVFIRGVVNSGFSGLLWSPEVRQADSPEDLVRRIQTVVFSPMALINCWQLPNPPWMQVDLDKNINNDFHDNYAEIREICRKLFEVRMSIIPYLYAAFAKYHFEGVPPFQALVMDYPDDPNTYWIDDAYMMGDAILVAPLVTGEVTRSVYLPEGRWWDFWSNELYEGGHAYEFTPGLEVIPVFVKDNTLLPIAEPLLCIAGDSSFNITVRAYGINPQPFILYEDDGTTFNYRNGSYNTVKLTWHPDQHGTVDRTGSFPEIKYYIVEWEAYCKP